MTIPNFDDLPPGLDQIAADAAASRWVRLAANPDVVPMSKGPSGAWQRQTVQPTTVQEYENLALFRSSAIWVEAGDAADRAADKFGGTVVRPGAPTATRWMDTRNGRGFLREVAAAGGPAPISSYQAIRAAGLELVDFSSNDAFRSDNQDFLPYRAAIMEVREWVSETTETVAYSMVFRGAFWDLGPYGHPLKSGGPSIGAGAAPHGGDIKVYVPDSGYPSGGAAVPGAVPLRASDFENTYSAPSQLRPDAGHGAFVAGIVHELASQADITLSSVNKPTFPNVPGSTVDLLSVWEGELIGDFPNFMNDNAIDPGAKFIVNMSMSGFPDNSWGLTAFKSWLGGFLNQHPQMIVVAAAGNAAMGALGQNLPTVLPAGLSTASAAGNDVWHRVVSVGATVHMGGGQSVLAAGFSNWGPWVKCWAEGVDIVTTYLPGDTATEHFVAPNDLLAKWSGTSFATPIVTAVLADELTTHDAIEAVRRLFTNRRAPGVKVRRKVAAGSNVTKDEPGVFIPTPT